MTEQEIEQKLKEMFEALDFIEEQIYNKRVEWNTLEARRKQLLQQIYFSTIQIEETAKSFKRKMVKAP